VRYVEVESSRREEMIDITEEIRRVVAASGIDEGICNIFVLHTTAGVTVNEGADPDVRRDILAFLGRLVPHDTPFRHAEGNSDAHVKSMLTGISAAIPVSGGKLLLGTWQSVYFCEFDGPRRRRAAVVVVSSDC